MITKNITTTETENISRWNESNFSCLLPTIINLSILTTKAGSVDNPQDYIIQSKLDYTYEEILFGDIYNFNNVDNLDFKKRIDVKLIVNYIELNESDFTVPKKNPPYKISFPLNFTNPFN